MNETMMPRDVLPDSERSAQPGGALQQPSPIRRVRHVVRSRISEYPALYLPFARWKYPGPSPNVLGPETELVIDGYTRSACTFAVYAFQLAQDRPVRMAHHLHAAAQLVAAAKRHIPTLVVIREPEGAVLSQLVREPDVALRHALVSYTRFYTRLLPFRSQFVVGEFEDVTSDFGRVIRRINERFGTSFGEFEHTEANRKKCFDLIKARPTLSKTLLGFESGVVTLDELEGARKRFERWPDGSGGDDTWVPSKERAASKDALRERWLRPEIAGLRSRAELAYRQFVGGELP